MKTKKPDVAGMFYPADKDELKEMIEDFLKTAKVGKQLTRAIIAPHAGYVYSGPIAASAYLSLYSSKNEIKNVIILSPSHHYSFEGVAIHSAESFSTPLGELEVTQILKEKIKVLPFVHEYDQAFEQEHALEVHLPFIQHILPLAKILPLVVGHSRPEDIEKIFELFWNDSSNAFVVSTDLSHFLPYMNAQKIDGLTSKQIENLLYQDLHHEQCCGYYPLRGLLKFAKEHKLKITNIDLRNSADTAGDKGRVVGYGSFIVHH